MQIDWPTIIAIATVGIGLFTAISTRQHSSSEVFTAAMEVAKEALAMRDKDIDKLQADIQRSVQRIDFLVQYTAYLSAWIRTNYQGVTQPLSYDEYIHTISQTNQDA